MISLRPRFLALAPLAVFVASALPCAAQHPLPSLDDPANLAGERVSAPDLADTLPIDHGTPALEQLLRKLRTRASLMLIVAHPDDEDGGMLTYLSRGQGARVAMLTLTRGEGGQNLMSADFDDALGLIRTQELLAADRYMGVDQFFGTEVDFGFSKTKEESFAKWTHERVLYDAVRAVRLYRPLVIAAVFIGAPTDGHGQHQVSGEIAQEVFNAAGDPKVFPDQIAQGLEPWKPLKVYARIPFARIDAQGMYDSATGQYAPPRFENYVTGTVTDTVPRPNVSVPEGATDALLGGPGRDAVSYVQFAREGLALQKTQIGGGARIARPGSFNVQYHRYGSRVLSPEGKPQPNDGRDDTGLESGFFEGIDTSLPGIASLAPEAANKFRPVLEKIDRQVADAQSKFDPDHINAIAPQLRTALGGIDDLIHELENSSVNDLPPAETCNLLHELRIKRVQLNNALVLAYGITVQAALSNPDASQVLLTTQRQIAVKARLYGGNAGALAGAGLEVLGRKTAAIASFPPSHNRESQLDLAPGASADETLDATLAAPIPATQPYFSRPNIEQPYYNISNPALRNAPATPPPLAVRAALDDDGIPLEIAASVPDPANPAQPISAVPRLSVAISPSVHVLPTRAGDNDNLSLNVSVATNAPQVRPRLELSLPNNWAVTNPLDDYTLLKPGDRHTVHVSVHATGLAADRSAEGAATIQAYAVEPQLGDTVGTTLGYRAVGYGDLPRTNYYTPATLRVVPVDVTAAPHLNIAYLPGTGDDVPAALADLDLAPRILTVADLTPEKLKQYDAVVLGVRAYEAHTDLGAASDTLNAYAASGGVVIVQYVARQMPEGAAPYPLSLGSNEKVVDEAAPVALLAPSDPLLNWPNKITAADFSGWVEERGHGFMASWNPHYTPLLESHDAGQQPQKGGLLVAHTGKGAWIYVALALYRQLPEGIPGPYRLFANLISAGKNVQFLAASPAK